MMRSMWLSTRVEIKSVQISCEPTQMLFLENSVTVSVSRAPNLLNFYSSWISAPAMGDCIKKELGAASKPPQREIIEDSKV
jgi:hypothetical protein